LDVAWAWPLRWFDGYCGELGFIVDEHQCVSQVEWLG
jgi:hypothetical protein